MKLQSPQINYRRLFDHMLDGLAYCQMIFDNKKHPVDFIFIKVNTNYEKLTGMTGVIGKKVTDLIPGIRQSNPKMFEAYGRVSLTGQPEKIEIYVKPLSKWFLISVYSPKKYYFAAVFENITERKEVEKKLEDAKIAAHNVFVDLNAEKDKLDEAKAKEEAILGSIADGIIALDKSGRIILINRTAEKMLGYTSQESMGKQWHEILRREDEMGNPISPEAGAFQAALSTTTTTTETTAFYYLRKDGTKFPVSRTVSPIVLQGKAIGAINIFRDITREKEIDRAKSEFVSLASHQLRTPTTAISWYAKMLLNQEVGKLNPDQKKYLQNIYDGNKRMIKLVGALLNVSRIELGTFTVQPETVNLPKVCRNVINELRPQIKEKEINLSEYYQNNLPETLADSKLIYIIFQNLLANAIAYTPAGGQVAVGVSVKKQDNNNHYLITVADTGIGIPLTQQDKIFTKLFRADNAKNAIVDGTGLGLYIIKSILNHTGGSIWFESEENKGTVFYVSLPVEGMKIRNGNKTFL